MVWKEVKIELSVQFFYRQQNDDIICRLQRPHQREAGTLLLFCVSLSLQNVFTFTFSSYLHMLQESPGMWLQVKITNPDYHRLQTASHTNVNE